MTNNTPEKNKKGLRQAAPEKVAKKKSEKPVKKNPAPKKPSAKKKPETKKAQAKKPDTPKKKSSNPIKRITTKYLGGLLLSRMAKNGAKELRANADEVNKLNVFPVPDGDTGDNMRMTIESGIAAIENMESDNLSDIMQALSHGMLLGARGNSGVIVSQFFAGIAKGLEDTKRADPISFGHALEEGVKQAYSSVMTPTEGTILTVAREAVEYAVSRINEKSTIRSLFADLTREMHASVERTPEILVVLKDAGVVDSGGAGLFYIIDGFNRVLNGEELPDEQNEKNVTRVAAAGGFAFTADSEMTYGYCTEALLQLQHSKCVIDDFDIEGFKSFLISAGDSVVAFKTDSIVKLHVHTMTPEVVLAECRKYGEFLTVKIENMSVQHSDLSEKDDTGADEPNEKHETSAFSVADEATVTADEEPAEKKKYAIVSVSNGAGVEQLFCDFGVDIIVEGGQTQNPSTNDFLNAFAKLNAKDIYVFPNNSNIFMAAQQAADLYEDASVHVIPSKNIGMGYVALTAIDFEALTPEEVLIEADEVMKRVTTGYVSPSIRDAEMNGVSICKGDTIGIIDKEIVVANADPTAATHELASKLLSMDGKFMLTVFCGEDATEEAKASLEAFLKEAHPDAEVYFINGGQKIYPFIFAAE